MIKQTQQERLLQALKEGPVNSYYATYNLSIKQAPTRVKELRQLGHDIKSIPQKDRSVNWVLGSDVSAFTPEPAPKQWVFTKDGRAYLA